MKVKSPSRVQLSATPWTAAYQAPPSMGFSRQEYWSGVPLPSPRNKPRIKQIKQVKNLLANAGDTGSIPGLGRSPGGGHGNPLQYSCLENARDGGAWWAAIYGVAQSRTRLKQLSSSSILIRSVSLSPSSSPVLAYCLTSYLL